MHLGKLSRPVAVTATALLIGSLAVAPPAGATAAPAPVPLEGRITDATTGEAVPGACVDVEFTTYLTPIATVCADAGGRYVLDARLASQVGVRTRAYAAGYVDEWGKGFRHAFASSVTLNPGSTVVRDFALGRDAGELRGTLRYKSGNPAGMVLLDFHPGGAEAAPVARLWTGIDGTWSLPALAPGSYVIRSNAGSAQLLSAPVTVTANAATTADLTLNAYEQPRRRLSGTVRDTSGEPVGGARVTLWLPAYGEVHSVDADAAGAYAFPPLPGTFVGQHYLVARAPGFADLWSRDKPHPASANRISSHPAEADGWTIDFVMAPPAGTTVTGTLTDADGTPAIGLVQVRQADGALHTGVSGPDGRYRFNNVRPGDVTLQYFTAGPMQYASGKVAAEEADVYPVAPGATLTVDNRLHGPTGVLEVRTVDGVTGEVVTTACVTVGKAEICDPTGVHRFEGLLPGTRLISVDGLPYHYGGGQNVVVRPDGVTMATLKLGPQTHAVARVARAADGTVPAVCLRLVAVYGTDQWSPPRTTSATTTARVATCGSPSPLVPSAAASRRSWSRTT
ncbi:carboxypeptidase regulatory-like domain-containing protein [Catellatospora bangladeshensis]|uniref:carboxypeptidase regulatory-like domain-containing protein n=1 Tax=Catellatospora bangladeshensis TaxID=310355 RepID=UPI00361C646D